MEADDPVQNLCAGGCGFYGSPVTDGFCSLCYKKLKKQQQRSPTASTIPLPSSAQVGSVSAATSQSTNSSEPKESQVEENATAEASTSSPNPEEADKDGKKKKNRCVSCRKKVGLTGFNCRCGGLFCSTHRYSDKHDCQFDYRGEAAEEIRRKNPVVVGEKVKKL